MSRNLSIVVNLTASQQACVDYGALQVPLALLYSLVFIVGLAGNLLALWVFFSLPSRKKTSVRVFLVNVALADLLLVACLPFRILYHSRGNVWSLDPLLCRVVGHLFYMNMYISVTLLGLISVDRYLKIHRGSAAATQHPLTSTRWSSTICAAVWTTSFALTLVLLTSNTQSHQNRCFHYKLLHAARWKAYINAAVVFLFWVVFFSLAVSYGKIALKLLRTSQAKPDLPNASCYARTARKSFFILFLFTVCFVPYHLVRPFYIVTQISETSCFWKGVADQANEVALLLSATNSCLDPVMYFLLSSSVRKEVLRLAGGAFFAWWDVGGVSGSSSSPDVDGRSFLRSERGPLNANSINNASKSSQAEV